MDSDALDFTMRLSRVFGMAPFVSGTKYNVSRSLDISGKVCISIIGLYYTVAGIIYTTLIMNSHVILNYIQNAATMSVVVLSLVGTYTASERIKRVTIWMEDLNQMNLNIRCQRKPSKKMYYTLLIFAFIWQIGRLLDFVNYCREISKVLDIFVQLFKVSELTIALFFEMQLIAIAGRVLSPLDLLNEYLEHLLSLNPFEEVTHGSERDIPRAAWTNSTSIHIENNFSIEKSKSSLSHILRQLAIYYSKITEFVKETTRVDGYAMILILIYHTLYIEINWHKIILWILSSETGNWYFLFVPSYRLMLHSTALMLFVESFHQTHVQMDRTLLAINLLKCQRSGDEDIRNELDLFLRLLLLNKTTYSPLGICTLARSLAVKICGGLMTFLVIIMTYGPEKDDPLSILTNKKAYM